MREARPIRFVVVGGLCFTTNLIVLYCGTSVLGWHYMASMAVSIVIANTLGWLLNRSWTFWNSGKPWWKEYAQYMTISFSSTLISLLLMFLCVSIFGIHYLLSSATIAMVMLIFNYMAHRDWSFAQSKPPSGRS